MKKYIILILLLLSNFLLNSQILSPSWVTMLKDSSLLPEDPQMMTGFPVSIKLDKNQNIYILHSFAYGWQVQKINSITGKMLWQNNRSFKKPKYDSTQYYPSEFFLNEKNNTLDVLGHQFWVKYPTDLFIIVGNAAKATYDLNTGKETNYICKWWNKGGVFLLNGGFVERKGGYFILESSNYGGFYSWLRKTNENLTAVDTLVRLTIDKEIENKAPIWTSKPILKKDKLYQFTSFFSSDKSVFRLDKIDTTGKIIFQKNLIDKFYEWPSARSTLTLDDGFILGAYADTSGQNGGKYLHYLTKLDTNGTIMWRSFLYQPDSEPDKTIFLSNSHDGKGWFAITNGYYKKTCNLYWVATDGKSKYLGKIKIPPYENERIFAFDIIQMLNKDLLIQFGLTKCTDPDNNDICIDAFAGLAMFKAADIQKLLTSDKNVSDGIVVSRVYPNPASDMLNISLKQVDSGQVELYDLNGRIIITKKYKDETEISWLIPSNISKGIYLLKINSDKGTGSSHRIFIGQ